LQARVRQDVGPHDVADVLSERWPDGPASHPWVLAVIRKYWLACEAINEENAQIDSARADVEEPEYVLSDDEDRDEEDSSDDEDDEIYPHIFVLEWLMTEENDDLATFLGSLSYWPVGLDQDDRYT
jgi:hypothetical protein